MNILIVGPHSYIASHASALIAAQHPQWQLSSLSVRDDRWQAHDYSGYDCILYCAAIVHQKERPELFTQYDRVNAQIPAAMAELALQQKAQRAHSAQCAPHVDNATPRAALAETASQDFSAPQPGLQFIYLSTMAVFGQEGRIGHTVVIDTSTPLRPKNRYAKSKLDAETALQMLCSRFPGFTLTILRPPMVYGPDCPGNYRLLERFALRIPLFPSIRNQRSMLFIDKLSETLLRCMETSAAGTFHPQDDDYTCTAALVQDIAKQAGKRLYFCPLLNPLVHLGGLFFPMFHKVWGGLVYEKHMQ